MSDRPIATTSLLQGDQFIKNEERISSRKEELINEIKSMLGSLGL